MVSWVPIITAGDGEEQWRSKGWGQTILGAGLGVINTLFHPFLTRY